jgi:hypothetical protein
MLATMNMMKTLQRWLGMGLQSARCGAAAGLVAGGLLAANVACGQGQGWLGGCDYATPYTFMTIAGTNGADSVDGTNQAALFGWPQGLAVATNGTVYVVDEDFSNVRAMNRVGTNWVVTTIAGTFGDAATVGYADGTNDTIEFNGPSSIAVDGAGNLFVADSGNNTIRKLTKVGTNWVSSTIAGTPGSLGGFSDGTNGDALFYLPSGIAVDAADDVFVADSSNNVIRLVEPVGTNWVVTTIAGLTNASTAFSDGTNQQAAFNVPAGLAIDPAGNLFVGDTGNYVVRKIVHSGTNWVVTTIAGKAGNADLLGAVDGTNGTATFFSPLIDGPMSIAVDANENVFVADSGDGLVRKVSPLGTNWVTTTLAGTYAGTGDDDGTGTNVTFATLAGMALDSAGHLFVGDSGNNVILEGALAVATTTSPNVAISRASGTVTVWWVGSGYTLQTNANLSGANWGAFGGVVNSNNGTNSVTVAPPTGRLFFRLSN